MVFDSLRQAFLPRVTIHTKKEHPWDYTQGAWNDQFDNARNKVHRWRVKPIAVRDDGSLLFDRCFDFQTGVTGLFNETSETRGEARLSSHSSARAASPATRGSHTSAAFEEGSSSTTPTVPALNDRTHHREGTDRLGIMPSETSPYPQYHVRTEIAILNSNVLTDALGNLFYSLGKEVLKQQSLEQLASWMNEEVDRLISARLRLETIESRRTIRQRPWSILPSVSSSKEMKSNQVVTIINDPTEEHCTVKVTEEGDESNQP